MALDRDIALLADIPVLGLFDKEALRLLAFASESRIMRAGDVLFRKDDPTDGGFVVMSGSIALDPADDGKPASYIAGPGTLIGEVALFAHTTRPATAIARESTTILKIPTQVMHRVLGEFPDVAVRVQKAMATRLIGLSGDLGGVRAALVDIDGPRG